MKYFAIWVMLYLSSISWVEAQSTRSLSHSERIDSLEALVAISTDEDTTLINQLNYLSTLCWRSNPAEAEEYATRALDLSVKLDYKKGISKAYQNIATSYWTRANHDIAISNLLKSLAVATELNDYELLNSTYIRLALVHDELGEYRKALEYHFKAISYETSISSTEYNNIGAVYHKMGDLDSASYYYNMSLNLRIEYGDSVGIGESYNNLGVLNYDRGNYEVALGFYNLSINIKRQQKNYNGLATTHNEVAKIKLVQKKFQEANAHLDTALVYGRKSQANKWILETLSIFTELETERGNHEKALDYTRQYYHLKDSLFSIEKARQIAELEQNYLALQKDNEIALLEKDNKIRLLLGNILAITLVLVLIIAIILIYHQTQKLKRNRQLHHTKQSLAEKEIENLQLKEKELQIEIDFKNKELVSYTLNFIQKNDLFESVQSYLKELKATSGEKTVTTINRITRLVKRNYNIDREWEQFNQHFRSVHPGFIQKLKEQHPDLSSAELRLCALLKLNLNVKESSAILGIGPDSVKTARYRLRKKLNLVRDDNLIDYIINI